MPKKWNLIVEFTKKDRNGFDKIRVVRPNQEDIREALNQLLTNMKFENCIVNENYIKALGMNP